MRECWHLLKSENVNLHEMHMHLASECNRNDLTFHIGFTEENYISTKLKECGELFQHCISMLPLLLNYNKKSC